MFKRHGVPTELKLLTFKCLSCGRKVATLHNGKCDLCNTCTSITKKKSVKESSKIGGK